jgi:hypothetical protein
VRCPAASGWNCPGPSTRPDRAWPTSRPGSVRCDIDTGDLIALITGCLAREPDPELPAARDRLISVIREGLRTGAGDPRRSRGQGLGLVPVCVLVRWGTGLVRWCTGGQRGRFGGRFPG